MIDGEVTADLVLCNNTAAMTDRAVCGHKQEKISIAATCCFQHAGVMHYHACYKIYYGLSAEHLGVLQNYLINFLSYCYGAESSH